MYTPFILIFLSLGLMILYVIKYRPTKKDSLPVVSNEAMRKGLHEQPGENRNEIMCQINNEIRTLTFKDRLEFEKYILGYLNSYFWLGSTAATLLTTVPILVAIIINEYTIFLFALFLPFFSRFFFQYLTCTRSGVFSYTSYLNITLFILESIIHILPECYNFGHLDKDSGRVLGRIAYWVPLINFIFLIKISIKIANNEDKSLLIGEAQSTYNYSENDGAYVRSVEVKNTLKIIVAYPENLR